MEKRIGKHFLTLFLVLLTASLFAQTPAPTDLILIEKANGTGATATPYSAIKNDIQSGLGNGTVTSVGVSVPSGLSVSGSPITSSGTIAISTTLNGNLRGNGSGFVVGNVALGSEVSGTLPVSNGGSGATTLTGLLKGNGTSAFTAAVAGTDYVIPSGNITGTASNVTGTVAVGNGGTGTTTLTGYIKGNGTSAMTAVSTISTADLSGTISNAQLTNNSITINGTSTALGSSRSITLQDATTAGATTTTQSTFSGGVVLGGITKTVGSQITGATTIAATDYVREVNTTASTTITIPAGATLGREYLFPFAQANTGQITFASAGSETFNGSSTYVVTGSNSGGLMVKIIKINSTNYKVSVSW